MIYIQMLFLPPLTFHISQMMTGIECGHRFCTNCWTEYLTTKIIDEGMGQTISCAAHLCSILVDDQTVMRLITDAKVKLKYQHLITKSFVEVSKVSLSQSHLGRCGLLMIRFKEKRFIYNTR